MLKQETWAAAKKVLQDQLKEAQDKMDTARDAKMQSGKELDQLARKEADAVEEEKAKAAAAKITAGEEDIAMVGETMEPTSAVEAVPVVLEIKNIAKSVTPALEMEAAVEEPGKMDVEAEEEAIEY